MWTVTTHAITMMEATEFPHEPIQTRQHLALPRAARPLCTISEDAWLCNRQYIQPACESLQVWARFLRDTYDEDLHLAAFRITEDAVLLLSTAGHVCGITLPVGRVERDAEPQVEE